MCVYVYIYIYTYIYIYIYIYINIHIIACVYTCVHVCMCVYVYTYIYIYIYTHWLADEGGGGLVVHYEYMALAEKTCVLREPMLQMGVMFRSIEHWFNPHGACPGRGSFHNDNDEHSIHSSKMHNSSSNSSSKVTTLRVITLLHYVKSYYSIM